MTRSHLHSRETPVPGITGHHLDVVRRHLSRQCRGRHQIGGQHSQRRSVTHHANRLLVSGGAIWLINVIVFGLWYWDVDRGGAAARSRGSTIDSAFIFPEMVNPGYVRAGWYPKFVDYLHLSFTSATAFSPTDVSAIRPWAKLLMMAEESISLLLALLVVGYAVGILK